MGLQTEAAGEVPEDTAAAIQNRLRDQAHQPDAAAAIDQIDPPRHLQGQEAPQNPTVSVEFRGGTGRAQPRHSNALLTSPWPSSSAASPKTARLPELLPQKTQILPNFVGGAGAAAAAAVVSPMAWPVSSRVRGGRMGLGVVVEEERCLGSVRSSTPAAVCYLSYLG